MRPSISRLAVLALLLALPAASSAQQLAGSFNQLAGLIRPGDTAQVTDAGGREVRGLVRYLSSSELVLQVAGRTRTFLEADIERIRRRRNDSLANGAGWGFAAGASLGALEGLASYRKYGPPHQLEMPLLGFMAGMAGAGVGALIDAAHADERVVYSRHGVSSRVSVRPILGRDGRAVLTTITLGRQGRAPRARDTDGTTHFE
jgi:hypothetical protein